MRGVGGSVLTFRKDGNVDAAYPLADEVMSDLQSIAVVHELSGT